MRKNPDNTTNWPLRNNRWASCGLISAALLAVMVAAGCKEKQEAEVVPTVTVQVGAAETGTIQRKITADAVLYPLDQAAIVPKISAPVRKFYVQRGSRVRAGQLLADLESRDLAGSVADSRGGLDQAEAGYQQSVQKSQQDLRLTKEALDAAQKLYDGRQALYAQGAIAAKDVDDARVALTQARNQYETAQKQLDLKVAAAQVASAQGKITSAEAQLSYSKVVSPIDGVVTDRPVYPGEMPAAGAPLLTVMNLSQVIARAHISPQEAAQLKVGNDAVISVPGITPDAKGKVTVVSPALDPAGTTVEVWVQIPNPAGKLKPGATGRVTMVAESVANTIVAPASALLTAPDGVVSVILLDTDNVPHKKKVKVGIRSGPDVQILEGLKDHDRVVTVGAFELYSEDDPILAKTKIQVQSPKMPDEDEDE